MKTDKSQQLFEEALRLIPGGVNSPVRAFKAVGGNPLFIREARGAILTDADGNRYIDYVGSWGPMILGHAHPKVLKAIRKTAERGTSFGAPTELEVRLAEEVCRAFPSVERVRFVNSGTEAVMAAVRAARGFTKRKKIIKFDGCYHGHADHLLVNAGSGMATLAVNDGGYRGERGFAPRLKPTSGFAGVGELTSAGVPEAFASETLVARYNDPGSVTALLEKFPNDVAAVLVEPVVGNMGVILPRLDFLKRLRELCDRENVVLIFDEVMTGFRVAYGGVQELYGVKSDLTTLGKIIGGGLPVGAYGGKREIMGLIAPEGPVYQAGTLSGNPVAMAAGLETLKILRETHPYHKLNRTTHEMVAALKEGAERCGIPVYAEKAGSMFTLFFTEKTVVDADSARTADTGRFGRFFREMLERGVYLAPSQFEACFVSTAHSEREIERTIDAARKAFKEI